MPSTALRRSTPFLLAAAAVTALGLADTQFTGLGSLLPGNYIPGNFAYLSLARDVSFDGSVVVGMAASTANETFGFGGGRRYRWTAIGGMEMVPRPVFASGEPTIEGVTDDGRTLTGTAHGPASGPDPFATRMLRQTVGEEPRTLLFVPGGGTGNAANSSFGLAISGDGMVVAGTARAADGSQRAAFWTAADVSPVGSFAPRAFTSVPAACSPRSQVRAVSRSGQYAVGSEEQTYTVAGRCIEINRAVRWPVGGSGGGTPLVLDPGSPIASAATAVSADGSVVVGQRSYESLFDYEVYSEMFRWTPQTGLASLGSEPAGGFAYYYGAALDVSADGKVIVGYVGPQAVVWTAAGGLKTVKKALLDAGLNIGDWILWEASAVSGNGRVIVGYGRNASGQIQGWRAELPGPCIADFNGIGGVTIQDVFDFLVAYFAGLPSADINGRDGVGVQDIFDFLVSYFAGCP